MIDPSTDADLVEMLQIAWPESSGAWCADCLGAGSVTLERDDMARILIWSNARRYSDGRYNVSSEGEDFDRARYLLSGSSDDDTTELVQVEIEIVKTFGRPKLEIIKPDLTEAAEAVYNIWAGGEPIDAEMLELGRALGMEVDPP